MELRQLRYLVALADHRSFTRAAEACHIAQPALSQQVKRLEAEAGLALVDRSTRRVAMTQAGAMLVERSRRILSEAEAAQAELQQLSGLQTGRVLVGTIHTMGPIDISLTLAAFRQRHPGVELTVREEASEDLAELLRLDELDLAFLSVTERIERHHLGLHQLIAEELVVILPLDHPLAGAAAVPMAKLEGEQFISFRPGARLRELLTVAGRHAGFEPQVMVETNESARVRRLVEQGLGVAILPRSDGEAAAGSVAMARLVEPSLTRDVTLAWRADRRLPPAAAEFLALARDSFSDPGLERRAAPATR